MKRTPLTLGLVAMLIASLLAVVVATTGRADAAVSSATLVTVPAPDTQARTNWITSVSCPTASWCLTVGYFRDGSSRRAFAEQWDGSTWSLTATPPPNPGRGDLEGVSCVATSFCMAVGFYLSPTSGNYEPFATSFDGTTWSAAMAPPFPTGAASYQLNAVSCATTTSCIAVGSMYTGGVPKNIAVAWNGSTWTSLSIASLGSPTHEDSLVSVSCPSTTFCMATGTVWNGTISIPFYVTWNGSSWSAPSTAATNGSLDNGLNSVSCASPTFCTAVGWFNNGTDWPPLVETWNGSAWSVSALPTPTSGTNYSLNSVSCVSTTACTAVGRSNSSIDRTFVMSWNGSAWSVVTSPDSSATDGNWLQSVSCATAYACSTVGTTAHPNFYYEPFGLTLTGVAPSPTTTAPSTTTTAAPSPDTTEESPTTTEATATDVSTTDPVAPAFTG